ncbi:MAG: alpha-rhamnosidase [Cytophagaceae bacterium]|nr:alpha-rhamnosidase [Cytophagaceae bacterium]|tara:strand:+ start:2988 stop:5312 length:2325 start_codon:yes stop_codon:yes gene_type:complete
MLTCFIGQDAGAALMFQEEQAPWNAQWIGPQHDEGRDYGVYYFRKCVNLNGKPTAFPVHLSADNRYKLFVNDSLVSIGPTRGDTYFWNYESIDLAPYLKSGKNTVAALVYNEAQYRPEAQISVRTGFIMQGAGKAQQILNTDESWKCIKDMGHKPIPGYFFAASKGELVDMNETLQGNWHSVDYDDSAWPQAGKILDGKLKGHSDGLAWQLVPSPIPSMELKYERLARMRTATNIKINPAFPKQKVAITIPAKSKVSFLLDRDVETNAYVTLDFSGGKDAKISLGYAEALYKIGSNGREKGNRDSIEGKEFIGRHDMIISNGGQAQSFTTLNFRTYRYLRVEVETQDEALTIDDLYGTFTGYPFEQNASLQVDNKEMQQMLDIGWRTARLNAFETYMDCPYYEQLQYIGDTRIQAMISFYNSGDDRLARNALDLMDHSRLAEGVTMSRYPTRSTQIISPFSLWYLGMLHDYWMYRDDSDFVKEKLAGARSILDFFHEFQQEDGSLKDLPYWKFVDWAGNMGWGPESADGAAAIYDLQLLWAYQWVSQMEKELGMPTFAQLYEQRASQLQQTIKTKYWDASRKLFADTSEKKGFSQHVNSLAILTGLVSDGDLRAFAKRTLEEKDLTQCTIYFKYYLHQAMVKAGLGDDYMDWLGIWRDNIAMGLTTWAEDSGINTARSDCHAWGGSPNIEFYRTVLGIDTAEPGFGKVLINPHLGDFKKIGGEMPHPQGTVAVSYVLKNKKWNIKIKLPEETTGTLLWKEKTYALNGGENEFKL